MLYTARSKLHLVVRGVLHPTTLVANGIRVMLSLVEVDTSRDGTHNFTDLVIEAIGRVLVAVFAHEVFSAFVIHPDDEGKRKCWKPPDSLQRSGLERDVHTRGVGDENCKTSLEEDCLVHHPIIHTLLEHGEHSSLADNQVGPLHNHNGREVRRLRSRERSETFVRSPLLVVRVRHENVLVVVVVPKPWKVAWPPTRIAHNNEVTEETGARLDHTDLKVRVLEQLKSHEVVLHRVTRRTAHNVRLRTFVSHGDGRIHISPEIDSQNHDSRERKRNRNDNEQQERGNFWNVRCEGVRNRLLEVIEHNPTLLNTDHNRREVVIQKDHVCRLLRHGGTSDTHGNTNIRSLEGWRVVHAVTSHRNNPTEALATIDNTELLFRRRPRKDKLIVLENDFKILLGNALELLTIHDHCLCNKITFIIPSLHELVLLVLGQSKEQFHGVVTLGSINETLLLCQVFWTRVANDLDRLGNRLCSDGVVACHHDNLDAACHAILHCLWHGISRWVDQCNEPKEDKFL
eukprot:m.429403 g.429403  ORF g.429403 m.429403 type:complete len:515 (-) comp16998_c0_seq1:2452-3996(-)